MFSALLTSKQTARCHIPWQKCWGEKRKYVQHVASGWGGAIKIRLEGLMTSNSIPPHSREKTRLTSDEAFYDIVTELIFLLEPMEAMRDEQIYSREPLEDGTAGHCGFSSNYVENPEAGVEYS